MKVDDYDGDGGFAQKLGAAPVIHPRAVVKDAELGRFTEIGARTEFSQSSMGDYSYICQDCEVIHTAIGKFTSIAAHVRLNPGNHPMHRASQSHFTYRSALYWPDADNDEEIFAWRRAHPVTIGHDVWIGHGVTIMPGVTIGHGAVIGAGAVVTKDVANYMIAAGVPAAPLRRRFPESVEQGLMALAWWDWSHEALGIALPDFRGLPVEAFIEKHRQGPPQ